MESEGLLSLYVSRALDCLGKSQDMAKFRVYQYTRLERWYMQLCHQDKVKCLFIAGSKGEGLTAPFESDYDVMGVYDYVICADDTSPFTHLTGFSVFETERRYTAPGYTKLGHVKGMDLSYHKCFIRDGYGKFYFSSDLFMRETRIHAKDIENDILDRNGPSIPTHRKNWNFRQDYVDAFPCICPQITLSFMKRHRDYEWPTNDQLIEISSMEGHVVPVGHKGSDTVGIEWRICYTEAERFLMRSLNGTQMKVYILLKMVAKTFINSTSKEITSYVLKNVLLWLAEFKELNSFKEEFLVDRFIQALGFLRKCINNNNLPSYMIPERNLFSGKLNKVERQRLVILLTELINEGGGVLMGCERLHCTMIVLYKEPSIAVQYRCKRDTVEKMYLIERDEMHGTDGFFSNLVQRMVSSDKDDFEKFGKLVWLVVPDFNSLCSQGHDVMYIMDIFWQRLQHYLS